VYQITAASRTTD